MNPAIQALNDRIQSRYKVLVYDVKNGMWYAQDPDGNEIFGTDWSLPAAVRSAAKRGFDCAYWCTPKGSMLSTKAIQR